MAKKDWVTLGGIFLVAIVFFHPLFSVYFSGDDFFHFKVSQFTSITDFLKFFTFRPFSQRGIAFYRPIFREVLFGFYYKLFGLASVPMRAVQFIVHFVNITLVYVLFKQFLDKKAATFIAFFYAISAVNIGLMYYLAGGIQGAGALMFSLLTLLSFWKNKKVAAFIFFVLALCSHEMAVALLPLLVGMEWVKANKFVVKNYLQLLWFLLTTIIYTALNIFIIGFSNTEIQYAPVFTVKSIINTLFWYKLWALGVPEMLIDFVKPGLRLDPRLLHYWGNYYTFIFLSLFLTLFLFVVSFVKNRAWLKSKKSWFLILWFIAGLFIFLFLPVHKQYYYLALSLPTFWAIIWQLISNSPKWLITGTVVSCLMLNIASVAIGTQTYPAAKRGRIAKKLIAQIKNRFPVSTSTPLTDLFFTVSRFISPVGSTCSLKFSSTSKLYQKVRVISSKSCSAGLPES